MGSDLLHRVRWSNVARVVVPRRANPGIEGGGAAGSATRGGTVAPVAGGTSVTVPTPAPTRDPAQGEFGFER